MSAKTKTKERDADTAVVRIRTPEIGTLETTAKSSVEYANSLRIGSDTAIAKAGDALKRIAQRRAESEFLRRKLVDPLNQHVKNINALFKQVTGPLDQATATIKLKIGRYNDGKLKKQREQEKVEQQTELAAGNIPVQTPVRVQDTPKRGKEAVTTLRKEWNYELQDITKVPHEFLVVNNALILGEIRRQDKEGIVEPKIPGIRVYFTTGVTVR